MNKLRTGDEVLVIAGKDKGKKGIVSPWKVETGSCGRCQYFKKTSET